MRCNILFTSYSDRLHKLNISLQYRRLEYDFILTYKICYSLIEINFENFFKYCSSPYKLRRHWLTLQSIGKPKHKNVTNFFSHRVVSLWNSLFEYVVTVPSLPIFKNYLKKFDLCSITTITYKHAIGYSISFFGSFNTMLIRLNFRCLQQGRKKPGFF